MISENTARYITNTENEIYHVERFFNELKTHKSTEKYETSIHVGSISMKVTKRQIINFTEKYLSDLYSERSKLNKIAEKELVGDDI